jgi:hypothetical protein
MLNVNNLESPTKRDRMAGWIKKQKPNLQDAHLTDKNKHWLRVKGWKKNFQAKESKGRQELLSSHLIKTNFKPKLVTREKVGHFISIREQSIKRR